MPLKRLLGNSLHQEATSVRSLRQQSCGTAQGRAGCCWQGACPPPPPGSAPCSEQAFSSFQMENPPAAPIRTSCLAGLIQPLIFRPPKGAPRGRGVSPDRATCWDVAEAGGAQLGVGVQAQPWPDPALGASTHAHPACVLGVAHPECTHPLHARTPCMHARPARMHPLLACTPCMIHTHAHPAICTPCTCAHPPHV